MLTSMGNRQPRGQAQRWTASEPEDTVDGMTWGPTPAEAREARRDRPGVAEAYRQASLRFELGEAVRTRREELGWSQRQLAERAGMTQPGVARFESGGTIPRSRCWTVLPTRSGSG